MIKLIIFDVDNTLAAPNMPINFDIVNALKRFESQGVRIALISGKPIVYLSGLARQLGLQYPILSGENGAIVYYSKDFPPEKSLIITDAEKEVRILENLRLDIVKKFGNKVWIQPNMLNLTIFQKTEKIKHKLFQYVNAYISKNSLNKNFNIYEHTDSIEVVPLNVNKGISLRKLRTIEKFKKSEIIAVGDAKNDTPMFKEADISIGINLTDAKYNFTSIEKAIKFIQRLIKKVNNHV
jgi:HAD superfamily hydrolase (TIGR01484 family)